MINYIVQVVLFQVLFLAVYDLFLQKETFFKWNRFYLLATPVLSFVIPFLKFESIQNSVPQETIVWLPEVMLNPEVVVVEQLSNPAATFNLLNWLFYLGLGVCLFIFGFKLVKILKLIKKSNTIKKENYSLVLLKEKKSAFSFFNFIFIHEKDLEKDNLQIVAHELVHARQFHTADLIFFELFKIVMWFNPLIYIYQKRITVLHEFISDAEVVKENDKKTYFNNLLSQTFNVENISFTNQFYKKSLIKKRIAMITKTQSHKLKQLKYLVLVPLLGGMLIYSSCETNNGDIQLIEQTSKQPMSIYLNSKDGKIKTIKTDGEESYFDFYTVFRDSEPNAKLISISIEDLTMKEKSEYEELISKFNNKDTNSEYEHSPFMFEDGRKVILQRIKFKKKDKNDYKNAEDVPFAIIDESPTFEICSGTQEELKSCFSKEMMKHVVRKFNADLANNLDLDPGKHKIYSQFKILKTGEIEIVGVRAPHKDLETEMRRVLGLLPEIKPGKFDGKEVNVTYMLPVTFNVQ